MANQQEFLTCHTKQKQPVPSFIITLNNSMILAVFPIIIDLHLNLNMVQNEVFYFLCSVQAPLTIGEVLWLSAIMLNLEGRWEPHTSAEPPAS